MKTGPLRDRDRANALAKAVAHAFNRAVHLANVLDLASELDHADDFTLASHLDRASDLLTDLGRHLPSELDLEVELAIDPARALDLTPTLANARDFSLALASNSARAGQGQRGAGRVAPLAGGC